MNTTLGVIERRKSTRAYSDEPVTDAEKETILHAAMRAPTAGNMMLYSIINVEDQALKDRLAETCDHQPFIARAPFVLLFVADYQRWYDYYTLCGAQERSRELGLPTREPGVGDMLLACCDALIAAQTAVIAAESLGIGSCYIGDILENYEIHRELLSLPRYTLPITMLCFGRPIREHQADSTTPRYEPGYIVHTNGYHRLDAQELEQMHRSRQERTFSNAKVIAGAQNFGQHEYMRKFIADFSFEMARSAREMLKNWE